MAKKLAELMDVAECYDVVVEPTLQESTGELLPSGFNTSASGITTSPANAAGGGRGQHFDDLLKEFANYCPI